MMRHSILKNWRSCRGMSLVEMLVVTAILSIIMFAVMSLYVPAHQSTIAQNQVSDVNSNLRLALKVMTQDLLSAGFLVPMTPIVFSDADPNYRDFNLNDIGTVNNSDFIIRSRIVGNDFARVINTIDLGAGLYQLNVSDQDMPENFPVGSKVRLFEPISTNEVKWDTGLDADRAYPVTAVGTSTITINTTSMPSISSITDIPAETVVVRVRNENQPPLQTIRYRLDSGALIRDINDSIQVLARNVDAIDFNYNFTPQGRVNQIEIALTGKTQALKNDVISGEKTRQIKTTVQLRNIK
jgi:prepilin-type N-terminal cleavage/methylation domain-containing protein